MAKTLTRYSPSCLCGQLDIFERHVDSITRKTYMVECAVCGKQMAWQCGLCDEWMCIRAEERGCHISLHNDFMFDLIRCDFNNVHEGKLAEWKPPNMTAKRRKAKRIDRLLGLMKKGG